MTKGAVAKHVHSWRYGGGSAKCVCGKYLQPDGKITSTPTGRTSKKKKKK